MCTCNRCSKTSYKGWGHPRGKFRVWSGMYNCLLTCTHTCQLVWNSLNMRFPLASMYTERRPFWNGLKTLQMEFSMVSIREVRLTWAPPLQSLTCRIHSSTRYWNMKIWVLQAHRMMHTCNHLKPIHSAQTAGAGWSRGPLWLELCAAVQPGFLHRFALTISRCSRLKYWF